MDARLRKIVELARRGDGGERESAINIVKKICQENNLDFDVVMRGDPEVSEYSLFCRNQNEVRLCMHVFAKFGMTKYQDMPYQYVKQKNKVYFKTTAELFVDVKNNFEILRAEFSRRCDDLCLAYIMKNQLFYQGDDTPKEVSNKIPDDKQLEEASRAAELLSGAKRVDFLRALDQ